MAKFEVTHALTYYRSVGSERPDENETVRWQRIAEAKGAYRELAAELRMNLRVLPMYWVFARLQWVLPEERIRCAAAELTVLSNIAQKAPDTKDRMHHTYELKAALGIRD